MRRPGAIRTAAIVANGRVGAGTRVRARLRKADLLVCADGGLRSVRRIGGRPHVVVGDFDSASAALRAWAVRRGARLVAHPARKDKTDAELALEFAASVGVREVEFFGALGGRLDHELANIALLLRARAARITMRIIDDDTTAFLAARHTMVAASMGDVVSLLPLSRRVTGVTTSGLFYPLDRATLQEGSSLGVSNIVSGRHPTVRVGAGDLLIVVTRRRGTHRRRHS